MKAIGNEIYTFDYEKKASKVRINFYESFSLSRVLTIFSITVCKLIKLSFIRASVKFVDFLPFFRMTRNSSNCDYTISKSEIT